MRNASKTHNENYLLPGGPASVGLFQERAPGNPSTHTVFHV